MDVSSLVEVLRATLKPDERAAAEKRLDEVHKIIGFVPSLLQIVMSEQVELPVRQAGVIYLKNSVNSCWEEKDVTNPSEPLQFSLHEDDKSFIRLHILDAIIEAPLPIRVQLAVCFSTIVRHDYPARWPDIAERIGQYLESDQHKNWMGTLICLHQLVKNFEYKKPDERGSLNSAMQILLPLIYGRCSQLHEADMSEYSMALQKQILKIFYALVQFVLPLDLLTKEHFTRWMNLVRDIVEQPVPEETEQVDLEDRGELVWWKAKKWAVHIMTRCFERYGSPGNTTKDYKEFAEWFLKSFSERFLQTLFRLLSQYQAQKYVSPRVLQLTLTYINEGVGHARTWKLIKPHVTDLVRGVIFPLLCHSEEDELLWQSDPVEYIRMKYDVFEEYFSPVTAAQDLLHTIAAKRKDMLPQTMGFVMQLLVSAELPPEQRAGALHMVGTVAEIVLKKKSYKQQAELILVTHVFPIFDCPQGYLRARACWVLHSFAEVTFQNVENLQKTLMLLRNCVIQDKELPVQVEAAIALQMYLSDQTRAVDILRPCVCDLVIKLLETLRTTENDDLTSVLQKLVCSYTTEIRPLAELITTHLKDTFIKVLEGDADGSDDRAIAAMGILNTLDTIVSVLEKYPDVRRNIEEVVKPVVMTVLSKRVAEFYEEVLSLVYSLTCQSISPSMWDFFNVIYQLFLDDGFDYFTDMMPALHNFMAVDPTGFASNPHHLEIIYDMCKQVLEKGNAGEDAETHAAKLMEVVLLQYRGQVDSVIPSFVEVVILRLTREVRTSELRTMCLQVVIAALFYNPRLLFGTLEQLSKVYMPSADQNILAHFLKQWLDDCDCFLGLHDRKMCALGLCCLLDHPSDDRPSPVTQAGQNIMKQLIFIFNGLQRAYAQRAKEENSSSGEEENEEVEGDELEDDDDEINEDNHKYLERLNHVDGEDCDDEDTDDDAEETALETYETPLDHEDCEIDEYQVFKTVLQGLEVKDPAWYHLMMTSLTSQEQKELQEILQLAEQRRAASESKKIQETGGYVFQNTSVPTDFTFCS